MILWHPRAQLEAAELHKTASRHACGELRGRVRPPVKLAHQTHTINLPLHMELRRKEAAGDKIMAAVTTAILMILLEAGVAGSATGDDTAWSRWYKFRHHWRNNALPAR
jgi:hypothetical protein